MDQTPTPMRTACAGRILQRVQHQPLRDVSPTARQPYRLAGRRCRFGSTTIRGDQLISALRLRSFNRQSME